MCTFVNQQQTTAFKDDFDLNLKREHISDLKKANARYIKIQMSSISINKKLSKCDKNVYIYICFCAFTFVWILAIALLIVDSQVPTC